MQTRVRGIYDATKKECRYTRLQNENLKSVGRGVYHLPSPKEFKFDTYKDGV
jgi:hypothetical protein